jgi:hypothetical protein
MTTSPPAVPQDPVQAMLAQVTLKRTAFAPTSRYYGLEIETIPQNGVPVAYLTRRFVPPVSRFQLLQEHTVAQGERLDNITALHLGDPLLFWRVCDANNAMRPDELTETPGRRLRITLPQGIPGTSNG